MAEAFALVGIVSGIAQLVDLGSRVLSRLNESHSNLNETSRTFCQVKTQLPLLLDTLKEIEKVIDPSCIKEETATALLSVIQGCQQEIKLLDNILEKVIPANEDSWRKRILTALLSLLHYRNVEKISRAIHQYILTLTFYYSVTSPTLQPVADKAVAKPRSLFKSEAQIPNYPPFSKIYLGLSTLYCPPAKNEDSEEILLDIVAVHGIGADPYNSWVTNHVHWLENLEMLPQQFPAARIMSFGYESRWFSENIKISLASTAGSLLGDLHEVRKHCVARPLVFVCHCFGGLVIQQALLSARIQSNWTSIFNHTSGVLFLGTPFHKTGEVTAQALLHTAAVAGYDLEPGVIENLKLKYASLNFVAREFVQLCHKDNLVLQRIVCFYEQKETKAKQIMGDSSLKDFVVDKTSGSIDGCPNFGLDLDHFELNKFPGPNDLYFKQVVRELKKLYEKSKYSHFLQDDVESVHSHASSMIVEQQHNAPNQLAGLKREPIHLLFYDLTNNPNHLVIPSQSYWRHLTLDAFQIYDQIYESCRDRSGSVSFSMFQELFCSPYPTAKKLRSIWLRLENSLDNTLSYHFTLAALYMLHVERYLPERPRKDYWRMGVRKERLRSLKRFGVWVKCECDLNCQRRWNFANDLGISQGTLPGRPCRVLQWLEMDPSGRPADHKGQYDHHRTRNVWKMPVNST